MRSYLPLFAALILSACEADAPDNVAAIANDAEAGLIAPEPEEAPEAAAPSPTTARIGPLRIPYDASRLAPVEAAIALPPDWTQQITGIKLIGRDRLALIDKAECIYGGAGEARPCNVQQEAGLSFALIPEDLATATARIPADQRKPVSLAGAGGVSWQIGAEGEGAEYILLPAGPRTVMIVRQFRVTANPDEAALGTVIADLMLDQ